MGRSLLFMKEKFTSGNKQNNINLIFYEKICKKKKNPSIGNPQLFQSTCKSLWPLRKDVLSQ